MQKINIVKTIKMPLLIAMAFAVLVGLAGCKDKEEKKTKEHYFTGKIMGTTYKVIVNAKLLSEQENKILEEGIYAAVSAVDSSMSTWKIDSDLSKFNNEKAGVKKSMPKDILYLVDIANNISKASAGRYDITIGALVNTWGFGPKGKRNSPPTEEEIQQALQAVGMDKLAYDIQANTMTKKVDDLYVDLSSIAKGFSVDKVAEYLIEQGHKNFLVEVGGELRVMGKKSNGDLWHIGIEKPLKTGKVEIQKILELQDYAVATSGNYKNYFKYGENYYGHTLNPITGKTAKHKLLSASIFDKECGVADGWATAMMALGEDAGFKVAEEQNLIAYFLISRPDGIEVKYTSAFKNKFGDKK